MPEEVKISPYAPAKDYKSDYCSPADDSHPESSIYADHSDREMSRSETSSCSDESNCCKQNGLETTIEIIPTRTIKTLIPKPAANPLQFVKIGPCDLYRSAQKQIQKVSEVKTPKKEVKDEVAMDWQSNLDSWKCNRRKQQEHIIERVVEVKKLELEEHDRNRKRTKTFSEMMEERTSKGRKASLPVYLEDDNDDLSDLGISSNKNENESSAMLEENDEEENEYEACISEKYGGRDESDRNRIMPRENGVSNNKEITNPPGLRKYGRRASATKIEEKLSELERIKNRSMSSTDLTESNKKSINIPKVNIFQRKELFEKFSDSNGTNLSKRPSDEISPVRSIKERLSSLSRKIEETTTATTKPTTVSPMKSKTLLPVPEVSVKERLSSINRKMNEHNACTRVPAKTENRSKRSLATDGNGAAKEYIAFETRPLCKPVEMLSRREYNSSGRSSSSEDYDHVHQPNHFHHRSLDSLQGHDSPNGFCFERVQSLEYINCCSNYPASVLSGDTDREDSGIHTADVSSSVSQADDFDLHADTSMDVDVKSANTMTLINDDTKVDKSSQNDYCFVSQETEQGSLDDVREHVDEIVIKSESCSDNLNNPTEGNTTEVTTEKNSSADKVNQKLDTVIEPDDVPDENQNTIEQLDEAIRRNHDTVCDSKGESPGNKDFVQENLIESVTSSALNMEPLDRPQENNQNFVNIEDECFSAMESDVDMCKPDSPNSDCVFTVNNKFGEETAFNFNESNQVFAFESSSVVAEPPKEKPPPPPAADVSDEELDKTESTHRVADCTPLAIPLLRTMPPRCMDSVTLTSINRQNTDSGDTARRDRIADSYNLQHGAKGKWRKHVLEPIPSTENQTYGSWKSLRRMDSTKRIKKQIRQKRSSFLGIESYDDDGYLDPELEAVKPPPDMTTFLQEERRLEQLLFRQSICSESDSTLGESRDSGVELDKNHNEESSWMPERADSRQDSEIYANMSITSEEDEIIKKEREILEILEMEERRNYETGAKNECSYIGEKLVLKLKELENQDDEIYWSQENEQSCDNLNRSATAIDYALVHGPAKQPTDSVMLQQQWIGRSLPDIAEKDVSVSSVDDNLLNTHPSVPNIPSESRNAPVNQHRKQPPPVPANKPTYFKEPLVLNKVSSPQQMSKQTLQALSAVPRSKITDSWVQTKKKPRQEAYNYQHWLIQEAEHRRITEYQQRQSKEIMTHNYVDIQPEISEPLGLLTDATHLQPQPSPVNRVVTYPQPSQMLPYRSQNQSFSNSNECKSQTKMQSNDSSNCNISNNCNSKPLPDSVIQTLTQRVQNRLGISDVTKQRRQRESHSNASKQQEKMLSVSGKKKCSHCGEELGRGAAMIIESLRLFYHIDCFRCCVCCVQLGDGLMGTDVRVRNSKLHCHSCYSNDEGLKFSCV